MSSILNSPAIQDAAVSITVPQYHLLGEAGAIDERTELIAGVIVRKMVKSPEHSWLVQQLAEWLRRVTPAGHVVRQEQPLTLASSEPKPDLAVVIGTPEDFRRAHPHTAELVIEVAISSEPLDREKAAIYAAAGVAQYWLVLPESGVVDAYADPAPGGYRTCQSARGDFSLSPLAHVAPVAVADLLAGKLA